MNKSNFKESRLKTFKEKFNCGLICDSSGSYDDQFKQVEQFLSDTIDMAEKENYTKHWCEITSRLENNYYIEFHRRGNKVYVSARNKGDGTKGSRGGVALQWIVDLEQVLNNISEDMDLRNTCVSNQSLSPKE